MAGIEIQMCARDSVLKLKQLSLMLLCYAPVAQGDLNVVKWLCTVRRPAVQ
jgi:hypothetical protein